MATVELRGMSKIFDNGQIAVNNATFTVGDGELLVLVGPSGCGKSTLLRLIAGLETSSSGSIHIAGRDVTQLDPRDRNIAMVFQSYALYPHMTVEQNLGFGLKLRGHPKTEVATRVKHAAEMLELTKLLSRLPRQLSGGQRQRVALGRALVRQPQVFLLDEPLSNLDAQLRASMRTEIARLHRSLGTTMIYVTHDQIEAMTLGQRIVVLDRGVVQQIDAPMRIYERPANLFVAGFLGNPAMNFLKGRLRDSGDALLKADGESLSVPVMGTHRGREIVMGIRPEDLQRIDSTEPTRCERDALHLTAQVELVEAVGNEAFIHARQGPWRLIIRTPPLRLPAQGEQIELQAAAARIHFFDAESGERIETGQQGNMT